MQMFEVGGCVRDELLGVASKDIDFSVVLDLKDLTRMRRINSVEIGPKINEIGLVAHLLSVDGFKIFLMTAEFLTIRARFPKSSGINLTADFVLARKESDYTDGRRPDTVIPGTLEDDLARRDFTMNAIAKDSEGNLIDPFDGQRDIQFKVIRAVGDPMERLSEDALRAVRAFRFAITKGFRIEPELRAAMESFEVLNAIMNKISDERIDIELQKAFRFNTQKAGLLLFGSMPRLAGACFAGGVSLDSTMKQKGRGK